MLPMGTLSLKPRYQRLAVDEGTEYAEHNFERAFVEWEMDPTEAALVLVDCWDIHPITTHHNRSAEICSGRIAPVVEACREAGVAVIHAPSPPQARNYEQWTKFADNEDLFGGGQSSAGWPPEEVRKNEGEYAQFKKPVEPLKDEWIREKRHLRDIVDCLAPCEDDFVIATGPQMHRLCRHEGIVHLFYAGFATNMCVMMRDYGMRAFNKRGYTLVLLRDCTTAIEAETTVDELALTEAAVVEVEMLLGYTLTSDELIEACEAAVDSR
jgi:nicotinamidase-related amidase